MYIAKENFHDSKYYKKGDIFTDKDKIESHLSLGLIEYVADVKIGIVEEDVNVEVKAAIMPRFKPKNKHK